MKRILMVLAIALVMVAMVGATVLPAFAKHPPNAGPFAGSSGNFKHQSNACQGSGGNAPKCVGSKTSYHK